MTQHEPLYDVAIAGAGPGGSAAATLLARAGLRVVLVDAATFPHDKPCAEYLSPAATPVLRDLGVLDEIDATQPGRPLGFRLFAPDGAMFQGDFAATKDRAGQSIYAAGLAVPRRVLDLAIFQAAQRAGAITHEGWRVANLTRSAGVTTLTAVSGEQIRARLVIAADGVHSTVARRLGLHRPSRMRKVALVAHMRGIAGMTQYGEMHIAHRRYVGLAPLESEGVGDLTNVAMVVDEARDAAHLAGRAQAFLVEALATFPALGDRLANVSIVRKTLAVSRMCVQSTRLSGDGLVLVGDAAGYYDPFTGEGIYRALHSAQIAASVALEAFERGQITALALAEYDRLYRHAFRGKRLVEQILQTAVQVPPLMNHIAHVLHRRKWMADTAVAVTGDFLSPFAILQPAYLARLLV
jgi:menaquinone-9 beta-reductase